MRTLPPTTTQIELAGARTGLGVGEPLLITGQDPVIGARVSLIRVVASVDADPQRSTRVAWVDQLGTAVADPVVYGFGASAELLGNSAPAWNSLSTAAQLAVPPVGGGTALARGGIATSASAGTSAEPVRWSLATPGLPAGVAVTAMASVGGVVIAAGETTLFRSTDGRTFVPARVGGPRRFVYFVGVSPQRMLAGAAGGTVYQSVDQGQTWSVLPTAPPALSSGPAPTSHQLPPVAVRCVREAIWDTPPAGLLAGTDAGLYQYVDGEWAQTKLTHPVRDVLMLAPHGALCATTYGLWFLPAPDQPDLTRSDPVPIGSFGDVMALAHRESGGGWQILAATGDGVWTLPSKEGTLEWAELSDGLPPGAVNALVATSDALLCAPASGGVYRITEETGPWQRCDISELFTAPAIDLAAGSPPPPLVAAFADYGITLGRDATLAAAHLGFELTGVDGDSYLIVADDDGTWSVLLETSLPSVAAFAPIPAGIVAAGGPLTPLATDWPGMLVAGDSVDIVPPLQKVAPGVPALIEQRTAGRLVSAVLDVTAVERERVNAFGRQTLVTRLHFREPLEPPTFDRQSATVWVDAAPLPLLDAPDGHPSSSSSSETPSG